MKKREKSAAKQFVANIYLSLITAIMPFVVRTVLIYRVGMEYAGVGSLFSSIIQVLNVADFGLTNALTYYLFKPAEENDIPTINMYMGYCKKMFHIVGVFILVGGMAVLPFLPLLVKDGEYPAGLNIYIIYIVYVLQSALTYLTNIYLSVLLISYLEGYLYFAIAGTSFLATYIIQIVILLGTGNYYLFTLFSLTMVLIQNIGLLIVKNKKYAWLKTDISLPSERKSEMNKNLLPLFLSKLRNVSRNAFDSIIVSSFFGLVLLAEYQNYYQIMLVPYMLISVIKNAVQPSLGNGIAVESMESNYGIVKQYMFVNNCVATVCMSCLLTLFQPVMEIWVGKKNMLGMDIVICLSLYFYMLSLTECNTMLREVTGIWSKGKQFSVVEMVMNLVLNVLLAKCLGMYGIILATIITVGMINIPFEGYFVFKDYFAGKYGDYLKRIVVYSAETLIIVFVSYMASNVIATNNIWGLLLRLIVSVFVPVMLLLVLHFRDVEMKGLFSYIESFFKSVTGRIKY